MPIVRSLSDVERDIEDWIVQSQLGFAAEYCDAAGLAWVLKYIGPQYLAGFLQQPQLVISTRAGLTWGDGVYVTPLNYPYSSMLYGRAGVLGWIADTDTRRVFDAAQPRGVALYQEWIEYKPHLFRLLTTTVHGNLVNRALRNLFRRRFAIDVVIFPPDQFNRAYVFPPRDRWLLLSDWSNYGVGGGGFSSKIQECQWVAMVQEEFQETHSAFYYQDLFGPHLAPGMVRHVTLRASIATQLQQAYQQNRAGARQILSVGP